MRRVIVGALAAAFMLLPGTALASTPEIGPCDEPGSIVVRVGQHAKVCVWIPPINGD